jgi:uncharacterized repeat protein (TIGR04138 family)
MSNNPTQQIIELLKRDQRYKFDAYAFVYESLAYAHDTLKLGGERASEGAEELPAPEGAAAEREPHAAERHLTGQQLCEAIRLFALEQYGLMAKNVLNSWGVHATSDFGEIVYNLIGLNLMRKTETDRREDFDNVYDFEAGLRRDFKITLPDTK